MRLKEIRAGLCRSATQLDHYNTQELVYNLNKLLVVYILGFWFGHVINISASVYDNVHSPYVRLAELRVRVVLYVYHIA